MRCHAYCSKALHANNVTENPLPGTRSAVLVLGNMIGLHCLCLRLSVLEEDRKWSCKH